MTARKPFGVEYLEQVQVPEAVAGAMMEDAACCTTWMSTLKPGLDDGHYSCDGGPDVCVEDEPPPAP
jgi:hypothetical protein